MRKSPKTKGFFPRHGFEHANIVELGYFPIYVSLFDHWLTEDEYLTSDIVYYAKAVKKEKVDEYMEGEQRFLAFYKQLAKDGAYVKKGGRYWFADANDKNFLQLQVRSLRGKDLMNVYFISEQALVHASRDRTDLVLLRSQEDVPVFEEIAKKYELHLLPSIE